MLHICWKIYYGFVTVYIIKYQGKRHVVVKKITTVMGDIDPEQLGFTLSHEHVVQSLFLTTTYFRSKDVMKNISKEKLTLIDENIEFLRKGGWVFSEEVQRIDDDEYSPFIINELKKYKEAGGNSILECTVHGLEGRPVEDLKYYSKESGVQIVKGTGFYTASTLSESYVGKSEENLKKILKNEIENGIEDTNIKPGFVKSALSTMTLEGKLCDTEATAFRAVCQTAVETGMGMVVHLSMLPVELYSIYLEVIDIAIKEIGLNPGKLMFCHTDTLGVNGDQRKMNMDLLHRFLDAGINISFDGFGLYLGESIPCFIKDQQRVDAICQFIKEGYGKQIMMGHDFGIRTNGIAYGGYGYTRVINYACPSLRERGCTEKEIRQLTVENPKNFLSY